MAFYTDTHSANVPLMQRITEALHTWTAKSGKRAAYRRTLREMSQLSNRELADLGIHRSEIKRIAYEAVYTG